MDSSRLASHLAEVDDEVTLTWSELDQLVRGLPLSAAKHRAWWSGNRTHVRAWRSAGFRVADLQMGQQVTFVRETSSAPIETATPTTTAEIILISCVKTKKSRPAAAKDLYASPLFMKERAYAERSGAPWFILSAEHGLVAPDEWLAPYERYLPDTSAAFRSAWGAWVAARLELLTGSVAGKLVEVHANSTYVAAARPHLEALGATVADPLHRLTMGERLAWYGAQHSDAQPRSGTAGDAVEAERFAHLLLEASQAVSPSAFLAADRKEFQRPGLYSWWVDERGAVDLTQGLGLPVERGLIYAGLAGATRWPSGKRSSNTLWSRIAGMHLGGNLEFSTFRHTLGAILASATGSQLVDEAALTDWMHLHLRVIAVPYEDADTLGRLEKAALEELDPPLNLQGMTITPVRRRLKELRRMIA